MRRTEQEFKEELLKRTGAYRREQARKRRRLLGIGLCACIFSVVLTVLDPFGAASEAPAAMDDMKMEAEVSMQTAGGSDTGIIADGSSAEYAAAPMAPEPEEAKSEAPAAEFASVAIICGSERITLDGADSAIIMDCLLSGPWLQSAANCLCDYTLEANGEVYRYHSDCGTIQNEYGESLTLSESDREIFNNIMGRCPMRIDE